MPELTLEQLEAVQDTQRAMVLEAAAGSGKTTVLVQRYLRLLAQGRRPSQILTVTFTNEAADQLRVRILDALRSQGASEKCLTAIEVAPGIGTLHSFCYGLLDQYGSVIGLPPIQSILTSFELATAFEDAYSEWLEGLAPEQLRFFLRHFQHGELKQLVGALFRERFLFLRASAHPQPDPESADLLRALSTAVAPLASRLEARFSERGIYSFDDLENLALRILRAAPEVGRRLQEEILHVLVDEFQDTSRLQWEILAHVLGARQDKLFVVGDPKQSIYGFRHADVQLFLGVARRLPENGGRHHHLTCNFRSQPPLLDAINRLAESVFAGSEIPFTPMQPGRPVEERSERPLFVRRYAGGEAKADLVRAEIREVVAAASALCAQGERPDRLAILFRVSDRIPDYLEALNEAGLPAVCKKTGRLFGCYDIVDLMHYLQAVENPLNSFALAAFLRSRFIGFSPRQLLQAVELPGESLYEKLLGRREPALGWFFALVESGDLRLDTALETLFTHTSYFPGSGEAFLEWLSPLAGKNWTVMEAVRKLSAWGKQETLFQSEQTGKGGTGIQLMTVHGAKGLEFPHVFLVDNLRQMPRRTPVIRLHPDHPIGLRYRRDGEPVTNASYEHLAEAQSQRDREESKRILYVALTRAERSLTLFLPKETETCPKETWAAWLEDALGDAMKSGSRR